jgi:hypothetical protein
MFMGRRHAELRHRLESSLSTLIEPQTNFFVQTVAKRLSLNEQLAASPKEADFKVV